MFRPGRAKIAAHKLMDALKNHLTGGALNVEDAFVTEHLLSVDLNHGAQKFLQTFRIERTLAAE